MMYHVGKQSTAALKPYETASGGSIAITQVMNEWELLMLYHIIHLHSALLYNPGLIPCASAIIPHDWWTAFITETVPSTNELFKFEDV